MSDLTSTPATDNPQEHDVAADRRQTRVPHRWLALIVLSLAQLMDILDSTIVNIALPSAQGDLGFSTDDRQWVVTGYALAFGSLLLLAGRLADNFGRRRMFMTGLVGFAIASAVGGAANGITLLLVARIGQGAFAALLAPAALSLVSVTFADNPVERGRAFAIFGAVSGMGGAVGLLLGGALTQGLSWRWCLYVNVAIAAVALAGAVCFVRDSHRTRATRTFDLAGTILAILALVGIVYGLGNAAIDGWTDPGTLTPIVAGLALGTTFVLIEQRTPKPLLPLKVVLDRNRGAAYLSIGFAGIGSFAVFLFLTYYLQENLGFSPLAAGAAFLPMIGMLIVGAGISGSVLLPRIGPRPLVPLGCVLAGVSMALLTRISADSTYAGSVLPSVLIFGLGFGLIFGPAQNVATSGVDEHDSGVASAMVNTVQQVGGSIGLAAFSSLSVSAASHYLAGHAGPTVSSGTKVAATLYSYHVVFWIAAGLFVASAAITGLLFRSGPVEIAPDRPTIPV